jgi:ornithine carbamoyltransferase
MNECQYTRSLVSLQDLTSDEFCELLSLSRRALQVTTPLAFRLDGKFVGLLFLCSSTRTRTAFWRGSVELGAKTISYGPGDLQIVTGESILDTGKALGNFVDALIFRNNASILDCRDLDANVPVLINAMNDSEHPTQGVADYIAICEHFGSCEEIRMAFFGPGNNIANTLALFFSRVPGISLSFYCPPCSSLDKNVLFCAREQAQKSGAKIAVYSSIPLEPEKVDVIYTTRWRSMGVAPKCDDWRFQFEPFRVDEEMCEKFVIPGRTVLMHDLPAARGDEISGHLIDSEMSIAWRQAYHKLTSAKVCLMWCFGNQ